MKYVSITELAKTTGLSRQTILIDIRQGKLKAIGGGKRGSRLYVMLDDLETAERIEYKIASQRLIDGNFDATPIKTSATRFHYESEPTRIENLLEQYRDDLRNCKEEIHRLRHRITLLEEKVGVVHQAPATKIVPETIVSDSLEVPIESVVLPRSFEGYSISPSRVSEMMNRLRSGEPMEPIVVRIGEDGTYIIKEGIRQWYVAQKMNYSTLHVMVVE